MKNYIFFEKDPDLDLEEFGLMCWLKFIFQKKVFSTDDIEKSTSTHVVRVRHIIRRLISKGYLFPTVRSQAVDDSVNSKIVHLPRLKFYTWADMKLVNDETYKLQMAN
jgi:hypothetical protein